MKRIAFILSIIFVFSALISCSAHDDEKGADTEYLGEYNTDIKTDKVRWGKLSVKHWINSLICLR